MPWRGFSFDDSVGRTEPGRARVPEGYYLVECEGMEPTAEDYEKTIGIYNKVRIVSGPDANPSLGLGGRLRDYNAVEKIDAQFGLGQTLGAYGFSNIAKQLAAQKLAFPPTHEGYLQFARLVANISQRCIGKRAVAFIADQPGQTRPFSGIESLHPETDWATYRQATPLGTATAPQAPRNGPAAGAPSVLEGANDLFADLESSI